MTALLICVLIVLVAAWRQIIWDRRLIERTGYIIERYQAQDFIEGL